MGDINVHRGLVFGMWARPPYSQLEQNTQLWKWVDASGLADDDTEMLGFWADQDDWHAVVHTSHPGVKATAYIVQPRNISRNISSPVGHLIIALASWADDKATFTLSL